MLELPTVITSSVIRSTEQGESHGGVYLVDLSDGSSEQVIDWDKSDISWKGRGADRGLRGIAFYKDQIILAASDELFLFDQNWSVVDSFRNSYLKHCHEIAKEGEKIFLTSTGYDSVLRFDLETKEFDRGYHFTQNELRYTEAKLCMKVDKFFNKVNNELLAQRILPRPVPRMHEFNPRKENGPTPGDTFHINNVEIDDGSKGFFVSGTHLGHLVHYNGRDLRSFNRIPYMTHNAKPYKGGIIANNTYGDGITYLSPETKVMKNFGIKHYSVSKLENNDLPEDHARQAFGRGLIVTNDALVIGGSSPATITVYDFESGERIKSVNITMDVRNAIHGLEIWPY